MDWFKKHVDTVIILGSFAACMLWMNGKFNDIDKQFSVMDKEITVIKTVLLLKNILPKELVVGEETK